MNSTAPTDISIRPARQDDYVELWRLASLDSAEVPEEPLLVAESDGEMIAALSTAGGKSVADPFLPTAAAVELLRLRASQLPRANVASRGLVDRLLGRPAPIPAQ